MSPVVRKWGLRFVVSIYVCVFSVLSVVTATQLFAADHEAGLTDIVNPETWMQWSERYGLPLVILFILCYFIFKAVRAVWEFFKPIMARYAEAGLTMIDKQSEFIDKMDERQDHLEKIIGAEYGGHKVTQKLLTVISNQTEEIHRNVKDIHHKFGQ